MKRKIVGIFACCIMLTLIIPVTTIANIEEYNSSDKIPTTITIHKPEKGNLYVMGAQVISLPFDWIVILGPITIEAWVTGLNGFQVEFYIDGVLKTTDTSPPFEYPWWDLSFGRHIIEVELVDHEITDSVQVFKLI
jgi:hypothetical protein